MKRFKWVREHDPERLNAAVSALEDEGWIVLSWKLSRSTGFVFVCLTREVP